MQLAVEIFSEQFASPDSADERLAYLFCGGTEEEVRAAAARHAGWQGKALIAISLLSCSWAAMAYGLAVGFAGLLAAGVGLAIFCLAQRSLRRQVKAGRAFDAAHAASRFRTRELLISFRFAVRYFSYLLSLSRAATLVALQRLFLGLDGLVHLALSKRLLPAPAALR
jgi:hypothetical protein